MNDIDGGGKVKKLVKSTGLVILQLITALLGVFVLGVVFKLLSIAFLAGWRLNPFLLK